MYKFVALFALLAVAAAQYAPLAYSAGAWPYGALPYAARAWPYSAYPYTAGAYPYSAAYGYPYNYYGSALPLDTPEVAAAKISHLQAKALVESGIHPVPLDTPEVAEAKAAHLKIKAEAESHSVSKRSVVAPVVAPIAYRSYGAYPYATPYAYNSAWASPYSALTPYSAAFGYRGLYPYHY